MCAAQIIPGEVDKEVALNDARCGVTVTFVVGRRNAQSWLESALINHCQGDVVQVANNGSSYTVVVRHVTSSIFDATPEAATKRAGDCRITGNKLLTGAKSGRKEYREAIVEYNLALNNLVDVPICDTDRTTPLRLNIALANLKLGNFDRAAAQCDAVLARYPDKSKALYRRGQSAFKRELYPDAVFDYENAKLNQPNHNEIREGLVQAISKQYATIQQSKEQYATVYAKRIESNLFAKRPIQD